MTASAAPGAPRRGRPRVTATASTLETREEILRQAAHLFSEKGVAGTRMTDIARFVGVRTPAIYYHFENLAAIVEALLTYVVDESAAYATAAARTDGSPTERLRLLVAQHVRRLTSGPYDLWFVAGPSPAASRDFPRVARQVARWRQSVARLVREGVASGELRPIDPELAVGAVSGLVYGALQLRHSGHDVDPSDVAELAVACLSPFPHQQKETT